MVKRKALVTGGAGFIGSKLSNKLLGKNYDVIVYDDFSNGSGKKSLSKEIKQIRGDILDVKKFRSICKNVDVIFHRHHGERLANSRRVFRQALDGFLGAQHFLFE